MKVDLFDFDLPPERIALRPASPRDSARLLVLDGDKTRDLGVTDLPGQLRTGESLRFVMAGDHPVPWFRDLT